MKIADRLLKTIMREDEVEANKILLDFGLKWFVFGCAVGWLLCYIFAIKL